MKHNTNILKLWIRTWERYPSSASNLSNLPFTPQSALSLKLSESFLRCLAFIKELYFICFFHYKNLISKIAYDETKCIQKQIITLVKILLEKLIYNGERLGNRIMVFHLYSVILLFVSQERENGFPPKFIPFVCVVLTIRTH